jgi:hypothetical protein
MSIATDPNKALLTRAQAYDAVAFAPPTVASIAQVTGLQAALDGKANATHSHIIGDVTGLQAALDAKADAEE